MAAQKKYPDVLRERAVRMVLEIRERDWKGHGEIARVAWQLDVHPEALRSWLPQAEIDSGQRPGTTTDDKQYTAIRYSERLERRRPSVPWEAREIPMTMLPRNAVELRISDPGLHISTGGHAEICG